MTSSTMTRSAVTTTTTESATPLAATRAPAEPAPVGLWMLTILIGAFFVLAGVCFWMGTNIH